MSPQQAFERIQLDFPFAGYLHGHGQTHIHIAETVARFVPRGSRIMDYGSGPCDKSAVLQLMGYKCWACDDLGDDWHLAGDSIERIKQFAKSYGVEFRLQKERHIEYEENFFDLVMLNHVLEHLHDSPRVMLNELVRTVRPGGYLMVTVPNAGNLRKRLSLMVGATNLPAFEDFYWHENHWRGHVREYVRRDLALLANYLGLTKVYLGGCDHMIDKIEGLTKIIYLGLTAVFDGVKDSWLFVARKPDQWTSRLSKRTAPPIPRD